MGCWLLSLDGMLVVVVGVTLCGPCAAHRSCSELASGRAVWYLEDGILQHSPHPLLGNVPELWGCVSPPKLDSTVTLRSTLASSESLY